MKADEKCRENRPLADQWWGLRLERMPQVKLCGMGTQAEEIEGAERL